jgi:hypothetical protein
LLGGEGRWYVATMLTREELDRRVVQEAEGRSVRLGTSLRHLERQLETAEAAPELVIAAADAVAANGGFRGPWEGSFPEESSVIAVLALGDASEGRALVERLDGPAVAMARRIITDLGVLDVTAEGLVLRELAPGISARTVQEHSEVPLLAGPDLRPMELPTAAAKGATP